MRALRIIAPLLFLSLFLTILVSAGTGQGPDEIKGVVIKIYRDSYFWSEESSKWNKIVNGMGFTRGDVLRTEGDATMVLEFDNNLVTLGPDTIVGLSEFTGKNVAGGLIDKWHWTSVMINLVRGSLYLKVKEQNEESTFKVISGLAIVETGGGEFSVRAEKKLMAKDDPERDDYLTKIGGIGEDAGVVSGVVTAVVDKGSVTLMNVDTKGNLEGEPVEVGEGEASSIEFKYIR